MATLCPSCGDVSENLRDSCDHCVGVEFRFATHHNDDPDERPIIPPQRQLREETD